MPNIQWSDLDPAEQAILLTEVDNVLGFTPDRASEFLKKSQAEGIEKDLVTDATGDFEHFLRTTRGWQGAVDVAWKFIEPLARAVVTATAKQQGLIP